MTVPLPNLKQILSKYVFHVPFELFRPFLVAYISRQLKTHLKKSHQSHDFFSFFRYFLEIEQGSKTPFQKNRSMSKINSKMINRSKYVGKDY